ncbi:MAG: thioredoxin domain-containing protein [Anaeromyxobacter sp.]
MKHVSWIVALIVGAALGYTLRAYTVSGGEDRPRAAAVAPSAPAPSQGAQPAQRRPQGLPPVPQDVRKMTLGDSPVRGPADALVTIVVVSDFQCPFCKRGYTTLKQVEDAYRGKVRVAFKHFPLGFHPRALPAAMAAEEARAQGGSAKFWEMHDKLFESAPALEDADLERLAGELKLDVAKVKDAIATRKYKDRVDRDQAQASVLEVTGTPAFFVNGRFLSGAQPYEAFQKLIDEELKKAEAMVAAGTPAAQVYEKLMSNASLGPKPVTVELRPDDPIKGNPKAPVTLVVFSDFQCPYCSRVEPTLTEVARTYGDKVRFVWKHQPLSTMHPQAVPAALAAEAARKQGKFWEMHDLLFSDQRALGADLYPQYAKQLKLDLAKFNAAVADPALRARIQEDSEQGTKLGAGGTPTVFINGEKVVGAQPFAKYQSVIDRQLAAAASAK